MRVANRGCSVVQLDLNAAVASLRGQSIDEARGIGHFRDHLNIIITPKGIYHTDTIDFNQHSYIHTTNTIL